MHRLERLTIIARARTSGEEPSHDFQHVQRVADTARLLATAEGARVEIAVGAALLHELFNLPKDHPDSSRSGDLCAEHALRVLHDEGWAADEAEALAYCIRVHSFSRGTLPETLEAKVLQDADRLDAIGAIGIARCFASCAAMRRPFYEPADPLCERRVPDDKHWGLDHFYRKLLKIPAALHTATARALGHERGQFMQLYLRQFACEVGATGTRADVGRQPGL